MIGSRTAHTLGSENPVATIRNHFGSRMGFSSSRPTMPSLEPLACTAAVLATEEAERLQRYTRKKWAVALVRTGSGQMHINGLLQSLATLVGRFRAG